MVELASNRNEYQDLLGVGAQRLSLTTSPPSVSCLGIVGSSTSHNLIGIHGQLQGEIYFLLPINISRLGVWVIRQLRLQNILNAKLS
jgi:hypothetical protein